MFATVKTAYRLLWTHRALHAKAIWPPIVFLVAAEFIFHKVVGDAQGFSQLINALGDAHWYWLAAIAVLWLAGLKFLLSFSISWRRHILLGEKFAPFFFRRPFWKYLALLAANYLVVALVLFSVIDLIEQSSSLVMNVRHCTYSGFPSSNRFDGGYGNVTCPATIMRPAYSCFSTDDSKLNTCPDDPDHSVIIDVVLGIVGLCIALCAALQVLAFNRLALSAEPPNLNNGIKLMSVNLHRYLAVWSVTMLPVFALSELVSLTNHVFDIDVSITPIALAESALRQACLFVHFSLGASIGMLTYVRLVQGRGVEYLQQTLSSRP